MPQRITGGCRCGAVRFSAEDAPRFALKCYCEDCRRTTGSGYAPQIAFPKSAVTLTGEIAEHTGTAASGNALRFRFCGICGSPVAKSTERMPDLIFLYAGTLDHPEAMPDAKEVHTDAAAPWARG
ncbi:MAG: GFA family protein [Pseudomonadota bacterium]